MEYHSDDTPKIVPAHRPDGHRLVFATRCNGADVQVSHSLHQSSTPQSDQLDWAAYMRRVGGLKVLLRIVASRFPKPSGLPSSRAGEPAPLTCIKAAIEIPSRLNGKRRSPMAPPTVGDNRSGNRDEPTSSPISVIGWTTTAVVREGGADHRNLVGRGAPPPPCGTSKRDGRRGERERVPPPLRPCPHHRGRR